MQPKKISQGFLLFLLCLLFPVFLTAKDKDSTIRTSKKVILPSTYQTQRTFAQIKKNKATPEQKEDLMADFYAAQELKGVNLDLRDEIEKCHALFDMISRENRYTDNLFSGVQFDLPFGVKKVIGGVEYTVIVEELRIEGDFYVLTAYMSLTLPQSSLIEAAAESGDSTSTDAEEDTDEDTEEDTEADTATVVKKYRRLAFKGENIKFSISGGMVESGTLLLMEDYPMPLGKNMRLTLQTDPDRNKSTYIVFNCGGFESMGVKAQLEFSRNWLLPEMASGKIDTNLNKRVTAHFNVQLYSWNDLLAEISFDTPFQVSSLPDVSFNLSRAIFDMSDIQNGAGFQLPANYNTSWLPESNSSLWRGVYIEEIFVKLPPQFNKNGSSTRTSFTARTVVIDESGFTGTFIGENLLDKGNASGWGFSLDYLYVQVQQSELQKAELKGSIQLPIQKDEYKLRYTAIIDPISDDYIFTAEFGKEFPVNIFSAKMILKPTSYIKMRIHEGRFYPTACLTGTIDIKQTEKGIQLSDIEFEELLISTESPYFNVKSFSFGATGISQKVGNFGITIHEISLKKKGSDIALKLDFDVNLMDGPLGFSGGAGIIFWTELQVVDGRHSFRGKGIELTRIAIDISKGSFRLKGEAEFFDENPTYGKGFKGTILLELDKPGIKVNVMALFGNINGMRYWFVDGLLTSQSGIVISPGISMYSFGGGVFSRVKKIVKPNTTSDRLGETPTGIYYEPDPNSNFSIRAGMKIGSPDGGYAFNGKASFEINFNNSGGISYIGFLGKAIFMDGNPTGDDKEYSRLLAQQVMISPSNMALQGQALAETQLGSGTGGVVVAYMDIDYDVENSILHGILEVYVDMAGVLTGIGQNNRAGQAILHFEPKSWYIHIGTPTNPIGLQFIGLAKTESYFMVGDYIPEMKPPPSKLVEILNLTEYASQRQENAMLNGSGFAFGSRLSVDTGDLVFLIFYARFQAGLGFDVMLKRYGDGVRCKGRDGKIGIDGWYARGQAFAYVEGEIGIDVNLFFKKGRFRILYIAAGVLLQAELPNPIWMRGVVGGRFEILGGLVSGQCKFEVNIGERCELVGGSVLSGIQIIDQLSPKEADVDVDVFTSPQATFSIPIGKTFELLDIDDITKQFRVKLLDFKAESDGQTLKATIISNALKDVYILKTSDILPPEKQVRFTVKVSFEEKKNGIWQTVIVDGNPVVQEKVITFTTGVAPDHIPLENIAYSYPIIKQLNFYKDETPQGYIQLDMGQDYLFGASPEWKGQKVKLTDTRGNILESPVSYDVDLNKVAFNFPAGMTNSTVYKWEIINIPAQTATNIDQNIVTKSKVSNSSNGTTVAVKTKEAESEALNYVEKAILEKVYFKSSVFNRFEDKFNSLQISEGWSLPVEPGLHFIGNSIQGSELFDKYEIQGGERCKEPLIRLEAGLNSPWYQQNLHPLVYANLGYDTTFTLSRDTDILGVPPVKAVAVGQSNTSAELSTENLQPTGKQDNRGTFTYYFPVVAAIDFAALRNQAAFKFPQNSSAWAGQLLSTAFPDVFTGSYPFSFRYVLPDGKVVFSRNLFIKIN